MAQSRTSSSGNGKLRRWRWAGRDELCLVLAWDKAKKLGIGGALLATPANPGAASSSPPECSGISRVAPCQRLSIFLGS
jgi:hypothetical protein